MKRWRIILGVGIAACVALLTAWFGRDAIAPRSRAAGSAQVVLRIRSDAPLSADEIQFQPASVVRAARLGRSGWLAIERDDSSRALTIRAPGLCPITLPAPPMAAGEQALELKPLFDLGGDRTSVGYDAHFEIRVTPGCPEARRGQISWRQLEGPALRELSVSDAGFRLRARTQPLSVVHPAPIPLGIVPLSPRTQGRYVLEARFHAQGAVERSKIVTLNSLPRSTGLPSLAVSQEVLLGGSGWHVRQAARGGQAQVQSDGSLQRFAPDAAGRWILEDDSAHALTLQALRHDQTPLDCGRAECHAAISQTTLSSPMSHALERHLTVRRDVQQTSCLFECHVTGERGLHDGGFLDVAASLGWSGWSELTWPELPRELRRLGGVRCTACHGPGAIPEPAARLDILRSDVCATCHDAPPNYVHVQQWSASRMARADESTRTRAEVACARCHTTRGFLERAVHGRDATAIDPDFRAGIACAACHAPHDSHRGEKLVRSIAAPEALGRPADIEARRGICLRCHAPEDDETLPSAASATLLTGRAKLPSTRSADTRELVRAASAHDQIAGGCIGCHGANPVRGGALDHSFRVERSVCTPCHQTTDPKERAETDGNVRERALKLERELDRRCAFAPERASPPHAAASARCRAPALSRALYEVRLVLEDPAAGVHNASFARSLLADAAAQLRD